MEYYSELKRTVLVNQEKTWRKLTCVLLSERSQSEKPTYSLTIYDILEKRNYEDKWLAMAWETEEQMAEHRGCLGSAPILYDATAKDMCHPKFVKTYRKYNIKSEP
jgi:hypothetical protein